jgi:hypothetical protein
MLTIAQVNNKYYVKVDNSEPFQVSEKMLIAMLNMTRVDSVEWV